MNLPTRTETAVWAKVLWRRIAKLSCPHDSGGWACDSCLESVLADEADTLLARLRPAWERSERPQIVCLCGSTRFWRAFRDFGLKFTLEGKIVLSIGTHTPDAMLFAHPESDEDGATKAALDVLHKHKIDLANEVFVLDVGGYVGSSTKSEIDHAVTQRKPVFYLSQHYPNYVEPPDERDALRADLAAVSLRAQEWEIKWAHADADLRACAKALRRLSKWHKINCDGGEECELHDVADAALARPGVRDALK